MTPSPVAAWAIKAPDGRISNYGLGRTRKSAITNYLFDAANWKRYYRRGYRCVRVEVMESDEG
jgi:hypothetical protein